MALSELFPNLNDISFATKSPDEIEREIITLYEQFSGRTLSRADPIRIFLNAIILIIIQQNNLIDFAAKQNFLAYSSGEYLEHLGALLGITRLQASHSTCTVMFTLSQTQDFNVAIQKGTRITPGDNVIFTTTETIEIPAGNISGVVTAQCESAGVSGNGYVPGQIKLLVDVFPYEMNVRNITESSGGSDSESDEAFRERIHIAPESFSVAGPKNAYEYFARTAHQDIIDVAVLTPPDTQPGHVHIYPLCTNGTIPTDEVCEAVYNICNNEAVRPDTDFVQVLKPDIVEFDIAVNYWIDSAHASNLNSIQHNIDNAVDDFARWQRKALGRDINPSELTARIINAGAKRCEVIAPSFTKLSRSQVAVWNSISTSFKGLEES